MADALKLDTRSDLLDLIAAAKAQLRISDAELCRRAGLSPNAICNLRAYPKRNLQWPSVVALTQACGYTPVAVPT